MFAGLQENQLKGALEALLFVTDEPVSTITLADMLEVEPSLVESTLVDLRAHLEEENRGIQLREVAGGWRLFTHPAFHELIEKYVLSWDTRKLSQAALETLAVVAYNQPVTRSSVASIRGVNSDSSINSLVEKGLLREAGTADTPGNPTLYATTRVFLEKFGLRSVADLPDLSEFAPDDETRAMISERLSATRAAVMPAPVTGSLFSATEGDEDGKGMLFDASDDADELMASGLNADALAAASLTAAAPADLFAAAASALGVVEKIDFDALRFETDDE